MTSDEHLSRAKATIAEANAKGEPSWRAVAEDMAAAKVLGASQRQIAKAVGMSSTWVHQMLKWRAEGHKDGTPFGPQSKTNRQRAKAGQATDQKNAGDRSGANTDQAQAAAARVRAKTAKAEAARARFDAEKATAEALRAKAEAARAEADARAARARANNPDKQKIHSRPRDLLVKALGMLGSDQAGERANAALIVEKQRTKLGLTWDELIIRTDEAEGARAA